MRGAFMKLSVLTLAICSSALLCMPVVRADFESWPALAHDASRSGEASSFAAMLTAPAWISSTDENGQPIEFVGQSGVVIWRDLVFAAGESAGKSGGEDRIYAIDRTDGTVRWSAPIERPALDSWSMPVIDESNGSVIVTSGEEVRAFDALTGEHRWTATLLIDVVNASPLVTDDLGPADRLFITDADTLQLNGGGRLYCINIDPFDAQANPYEPGEIVWAAPLNAATSGNTPAYANGVVFAADSGRFASTLPGSIRAFDAHSTSTPPAPIWTFTNIIGAGFYGGISVRDGFAYAASYNFFGGQTSSNLVKLDVNTGELVWSAPSNRTDSLPIVLSDGRVLISTGLTGFGSLPSLQLFASDGTLIWDSAIETFEDSDGDDIIEIGEFFAIGGWTHIPVVIESEAGAFAYAGTPPLAGGFFGPHTDLHLIDLDRAPNDAAFVIESFNGAGSTPAVADSVLYTIGATGLHAFGAFAGHAPGDVNRDCRVDTEDLYSWEAGEGERDVTRDGTIDANDRAALIAALRAHETGDLRSASR